MTAHSRLRWAGLQDVRIHKLRLSYASRALALGKGLLAIGRPLAKSASAPPPKTPT